MERLEVFKQYCHHMSFLRASRNRIHNSQSSAAVRPIDMEEMKTVVDQTYKLVCKHSKKLLRVLKAACDGRDIDLAGKSAVQLNKFTRNFATFSSVLEEEIIPHKDFDDDDMPGKANPAEQLDCTRYLVKLNDAAHNVRLFVAKS